MSRTRTRVVKTLSPTQSGALKLAKRHGAALICVRHRHSEDGATRYTTVELVVDEVRIARRIVPRDHDILVLNLRLHERDLRQQVVAAGGWWDADLNAWKLSRAEVERLQLMAWVMGA